MDSSSPEQMSTENNNSPIMDQIIGVLLCLAGLAFIALLIMLKLGGQLAGDLKASGFLFSTGVALLWIGGRWVISCPERQPTANQQKNLGQFLVKLRGAAESIAALGCVLMLARAVAICGGWRWPPTSLLSVLVATPIVIGLFTVRILVPGAFQSSPFSDVTIALWSSATRLCMNTLLRTGWVGYFAIPVAWPYFHALVPSAWRPAIQVLASVLLSVLYASQLLTLHFGRIRTPAASGDTGLVCGVN